jgi:FemAB-related protein (PEP-CTERM system-associated)
MIEVVEHTEAEHQLWEDYVNNSPSASGFHLWGWKRVFEKTFRLKTHYLAAQVDGKVAGVLPLFFVRSPVFGNYLTSLPGGAAGEDDEVLSALIKYGVELTKKKNARYLAIRDGKKKLEHPGLETDDRQVSMTIDMAPEIEEIHKNISRTTRQRTKKARKKGVDTVNDIKMVEPYYPIYSASMRERGTPTQGYKFFKNAAEEFPKKLSLLAIEKDGEIMGGGYSFIFNNTLECLWSGMLREFFSLNISYVLIWDTIEYANQEQVRWLELGRSQVDSGTFKHKKQWGAAPVQLYQQYYLNKGEDLPSAGNSRNEQVFYRSFVNVWQRLPLPVTDFLGPILRTQVPFG